MIKRLLTFLATDKYSPMDSLGFAIGTLAIVDDNWIAFFAVAFGFIYLDFVLKAAIK